MSLKTYKHIAVDPKDYERFIKLGSVGDSQGAVFKRLLDQAGAV